MIPTSAARKGSTQNQTKQTKHLLNVQTSRACGALVVFVVANDAKLRSSIRDEEVMTTTMLNNS